TPNGREETHGPDRVLLHPPFTVDLPRPPAACADRGAPRRPHRDEALRLRTHLPGHRRAAAAEARPGPAGLPPGRAAALARGPRRRAEPASEALPDRSHSGLARDHRH